MNFSSMFGSHAKQCSMSVTTTSIQSPLHIPEIISMIFFYLDQYTLSRNAQFVCRQWRSLSSSHIHKSASLYVSLKSNQRLERVLSTLPSLTTLSISTDRCWDIETAQWISSKVDSLKAQNKLRVSRIDANSVFAHDALLYPLLPKFNALTEINMSRIMEDVDLGIIIASCNELLSFRIVNQWYGSYRINISTLPGTDPATLQPINSKIQSLAMTGMCIDLEALESLLGRCPKLTSIKLVHIRQIESPLGKENFYDSVTKSCPELKQFHFSTLNDSPAPDHAHSLMHTSFSSSTYIPSVSKDGESKEEEVEGQSGDQLVRQIKSNINTISILDSDVKEETASILFSPLMDPILSQFVSRLEIMPSIGHVKYNCLINTLHNVLCSAPNLLHLIAPSVPYYAEYFDLTSPQNNNKVWACRGLRTLKLRIVSRDENNKPSSNNSRIMFSYISRVCPNLHELAIYKEELNLKLEGGLCFLSRLKELRRLAVVTRTKTKLKKKDLAWMSSSNSNQSRSWFSGWFGLRRKSSLKSTLALSRTVSSDITCVNGRMIENFKEIGTETDFIACKQELNANKDNYGGVGCWPRLSYLGIRHTDNNHNDPDDYLPSLMSKIRPGVEFSCNYNELLEIE